MMRTPVRLFHITALTNLEAICLRQSLISKNKTGHHGINYQNIAHSGAQSSRSKRIVPNPPGGTLHDFVPFYFAPRSPMLSAIVNGSVDGCQLSQEDIIYFETTVDNVLAFGLDFIFYDRNATYTYSQAYTDLNLLDSVVDWELLSEKPTLDGFCKYFFDKHQDQKYVDRMEKRQAEFLVKHELPLDCITRIGVINRNTLNNVSRILLAHKLELKVDIMTDWYFLGQ
ncbi:TPA: type II toxin-antitoxin system toxin DNA ADP-ribosyl transferase DarT [Legionella pneumophila]